MRECVYGVMQSFSREQIDLIAARARALGDGTRVRILTVLRRGEQPVGQIADAAGTQQSTASKHLQVLFHAGLVQRRRAAATVIYSITSTEVLKLLRHLGRRRIAKAARGRIGSGHSANGVAGPRRKRA
jgi:DNA-binding transcriptional ArsR family regulator